MTGSSLAKSNISRPQVSSALFFQYNTALVPPYQVLVDTNFLSHTVQKKLEILPTMMDCLYAKCIPIITDCVMAELEKLGTKYRIALRIARDERWERLQCGHKGTYADDCIVDRIMRHKIYIVATNDRDLKRRIRKIPGVPIMSVARGKYLIERLPGEFPNTVGCRDNQLLSIVTRIALIHPSSPLSAVEVLTKLLTFHTRCS